MNLRRLGSQILLGLTAACVLFSGCGSKAATNVVAVSVFPASSALIVNQSQTFTASVSGATDTSVTWSLSSVPASSTANPPPTPTPCDDKPDICGKIDDKTSNPVTFTAPAKVQNPAINILLTATAKADTKKTAKATIAVDSGIRVRLSPTTATVGTGESFRFTPTLTNDTIPNDVTWLVTQATTISSTAASCSPGCGSVDSTGQYAAPATVPTTPTVTVVAVSKVDTSRFGIATVTVVTAAASTFTGIVPTIAAQGALFQDVYLQATNLRSTSVISFNGNALDPSQIKITTVTNTTTSGTTTTTTTTTSARIRLTADQLSVPNTTTGFSISVDGATGGPFFLQVVPVRPGLASSRPASTAENQNSGEVFLNGGFFGTQAAPAVAASFGGGTGPGGRPANIATPRQLKVTLSQSDLGQPGLYSLSLQNSNGAVGTPATNLAVQPDPASDTPSFVGLLSAPPASCLNPGQSAFNNPGAIALDSTLGIAIVSNQGSNTVQRMDMNGGNPVLLGCPIGSPVVGNAPTGVAVDELQHIAAVVNSTDKTVSLLNLQTGAAIGLPIDLSQIVTGVTAPAPAGLPFSVGLEPNAGLGLVAFSSTNVGAIFNYNSALPAGTSCIAGTAPTSPYCVIGVVTMFTGVSPQIAFNPRLHWGFVTPGGKGSMTVVDVNRLNTVVPIAAAPDGLKRSGKIVTVTTTQAHNLPPLAPGSSGAMTVLITGAADPSFNGAFTVLSVINSQSFTFSQDKSDATSGGGQINYSAPLLTFTLGTTTRGISINPETQTAFLTDPNSQEVFFLSTLDQTSLALFLSNNGAPEIGATGTSFQPFSNIAVSVNPTQNQLSILDPVRPQRLGTPIATQGTGSGAVVVDPSTNLALVANSGSNDVSVIRLSNIKPVHISQWIPQAGTPTSRMLASQTTFTSASDLPISIFGSGFAGSPQVRLDGVSVGTGTVVSDRRLDITIPASTFLAAPRRYALDVLNGGTLSNASDFTVVQAVDLTSTSCASPLPAGVTIDEQRDIAMVTNSGCNTASVIDVSDTDGHLGEITQTISVGTAPTGVAISPRLGIAVVANSNMDLSKGTSLGAGSVSLIDLTSFTVTSTLTVGVNPTGVAMNNDTGRALVTNTGSNTLSQIDLNASPPKATSSAVDQQPISVAVDPDRAIAIVGGVTLLGTSESGVLDIVDISTAFPSKRGTIGSFLSLPTGVVFDPSNTLFYAVSSLSNQFIAMNPDTGGTFNVRVGVNPASLAGNFQTGTLITVNALSNTLSVVDTQSLQTKATLSLGNPPQPAGGSNPLPGATNPQFAVALHPRSNLAVIADPFHNRALLYPVPH